LESLRSPAKTVWERRRRGSRTRGAVCMLKEE
jgi:hypothetical protein